MDEKINEKLKKIQSKIQGDDFNKAELLSFRAGYKEIISVYPMKITSEFNLRSVIAILSNEVSSVVVIYLYMLIFLTATFCFVGETEGAGLFFGVMSIAAVVHFIYTARKNKLGLFTQVKLVNLYIRSVL
ncbi:hypothetical protein C1Y43_15205 [Pantoea sp. ICBG 828]|uniref:hypothetical protein n=1 Tax=Pantoea TaxID=53335 RepID=UPI000CE3662E|nr:MULTISPECIES: hypothetical protein [Pantoea]MBS0898589.1 hypothetical protein [Pantoea dispersa]NIG35523.1 hypothetical protein [Pantoea sp. Ap-959]PPC66938.1 hypothetical protein C1Y43_15205 [Pantoea sp. ICBG 828]